jgi:hypothetical protein
MKKILLVALLFLSCFCYAQTTPCESFKTKEQRWALSTTAGYINVSNFRPVGAAYQSNVWSSLNLNYSVQKWSFGTWAALTIIQMESNLTLDVELQLIIQ